MLGYAISAIIVSTCFALTLIGTHFAMDAEFPSPDDTGKLPGSWAYHVLRTSLDWNPAHPFYTFLFGGANAHVAHHLFPSVNHMHYVSCTKLIQDAAKKYQLPYHATNLRRMVYSHFAFLRKMAVTA